MMMVLRVGCPENQIVPVQFSAPVAVSQHNNMRITVLSGLEMILEFSFPMQVVPMPEQQDRLKIFQYMASREARLALLPKSSSKLMITSRIGKTITLN